MKNITLLFFWTLMLNLKSQTENLIFNDSFLTKNHVSINYDYFNCYDFPERLAGLIDKDGILKHLDKILSLDEYDYDYLIDNMTSDSLKKNILLYRKKTEYINYKFYDSVNNIMEYRDQKFRGKYTKDMPYRKDSILKMDSINFILLKKILNDSLYINCNHCPDLKSSVYIHIDNFDKLLEINKELIYLIANNRFHPYTYFWVVDRAYYAKYSKPFFYYCVNYMPKDFPNLSKEEIEIVNIRRKIFGLPIWPQYNN
jgi:hypothetical protein